MTSASLRVVSAVDELGEVNDTRAVAVLVVIPVHRPHTDIRYYTHIGYSSQGRTQK